MIIYSFFDQYSRKARFCCYQMGILSVGHNNIDLDDTNYDLETIIHIRLLPWHIKFEKRKALKKDVNEKVMLVAWHPKE